MNPMQSLVRFRGLNANDSWREMVNQLLARLWNLATISAAEVVLERQREAKPAFRVKVNLAIPGPDIHAEAAGPTLQTALYKAIDAVKRQLVARAAKRSEKEKARRHAGLVSAPWAGGYSPARA